MPEEKLDTGDIMADIPDDPNPKEVRQGDGSFVEPWQALESEEDGDA